MEDATDTTSEAEPTTSSVSDEPIETAKIVVYGGRMQDVQPSLEKHLVSPEEAHIYQTWVSVNALRRLGLLFQGGAESAGAISDLLCLIVVIAVIVAGFAFWQIFVFFIVIAVLALLSGGAALRYVRGTFIFGDEKHINIDGFEAFTTEQLAVGRFVSVELTEYQDRLDDITKSANKYTSVFREGIHVSLAAATVFLIVELVYWFLFNQWLTDIIVLGAFGIAFLGGVVAMDIGVLLRRRLAGKLVTS
ncbi:MAG: hypothetical protein JSW61_15095 [Candidatus Thorarchaeota archaeon]|nr:MAG: hypothetical protein JSW61_15095 [Candidatus Thorarchaeota archaeon]